jgi:Histone deacetylase domain
VDIFALLWIANGVLSHNPINVIFNSIYSIMTSRTGYFTHPDCRKHEMGRGHPECPERLDAINDHLLYVGLLDHLSQQTAPLADLEVLELAHSKHHIASIDALNDALQQEITAGGKKYAQIDPDTAMNAHTWSAVRHATGAALAATDAVIAGELANAFCAIRPPGHHAEHDRAMGFCVINSVATAAKYALEHHGLSRVIEYCSSAPSNTRFTPTQARTTTPAMSSICLCLRIPRVRFTENLSKPTGYRV